MEANAERMADAAFGRLPAPRLIRRLAAVALTWITVRRGFDEALVRAGPPRRRPEGPAGAKRTGASDAAR